MDNESRKDNSDELAAGSRAVDSFRISTTGDGVRSESTGVVEEAFFTITVEGVGSYVLMCTPGDRRALAVGFLFSEGLIRSIDDIDLLYYCNDDPNVASVRLTAPPAGGDGGRTLIVASSCGMCGSRDVEEVLAGLNPLDETLKVSAGLLTGLADRMAFRQELFRQTGGAHAACIFRADGTIIAFAEDIGRHNALDKAIGKCLLERAPTGGCGAILSGRLSFELASKASHAGIEVAAAVSAPSSFAIEVAERCNLTLCGFVRPGRITVFAGRQRITDLQGAGGCQADSA